MARGPFLTIAEIDEAEQLYQAGLSWRNVGAILHRDPVGLCRRVTNKRTMSEALRLRHQTLEDFCKHKGAAA